MFIKILAAMMVVRAPPRHTYRAPVLVRHMAYVVAVNLGLGWLLWRRQDLERTSSRTTIVESHHFYPNHRLTKDGDLTNINNLILIWGDRVLTISESERAK